MGWFPGAGAAARARLAKRAAFLLDRLPAEPRCLEVRCDPEAPGIGAALLDVEGRAPELVTWPLASDGPVAIDARGHAFDLVVGCGLLSRRDPERTLAEVHRVLRPGGGVWLAEPNRLNLRGLLRRGAFVRQRLRGQLLRSGFAAVDVRSFGLLRPFVPGPLGRPAGWVDGVLERAPLVRETGGWLEVLAWKHGRP